MNKLTNEQELQMWIEVKKILDSIPNDYRSQNHTNYLAEIDMRVYETNEIVNYLKP
jgi:hypothetical protein